MRFVVFLFSALLIVRADLNAQDIISIDEGAAGAYLKLRQLRNPASVLHVVAHPDDEDGAFLAYCARGLGARTMLFSITRGEGGANLISDHFFDELGALRTLEHLKAAGYYGNQLFYSRAADYGYSKTLDEAKRQWEGGRPILKDLVEVIRRERPTVIVSRFRGDRRDGHGHHQMAGVLARMAFDVAADPDQFPEMLEQGLLPWQANKLFVGLGFRGNADPEDKDVARLPTGTYDPILGQSYAQVARFGLGFQRSQGLSGHDGDPGARISAYRLVKVARQDTFPNGQRARHETGATLLNESDTSYRSLLDEASAGEAPVLASMLEKIDHDLGAIWDQWTARSPESSVKAIVNVLKDIRGFDPSDLSRLDSPTDEFIRQHLSRLETQLQDAIAVSAGIQFDAIARKPDGGELEFAVINTPLQVDLRVANQNNLLPIELVSLDLGSKRVSTERARSKSAPTDEQPVLLKSGMVFESSMAYRQSVGEPTRPNWSRQSIRQPLYEVTETWHQNPLPAHPLHAKAVFRIAGVLIRCNTTVQNEFRDPELGQVRYPLSAVPSISVRLDASETVLPADQEQHPVNVIVRSFNDEPTQATVELEMPKGWSCDPESVPIAFRRGGEVKTIAFALTPPAMASGEHQIQAVVSARDQEFREGLVTVTARDVGRLNFYRPATQTVRIADVALTWKPSVGYITGSGDEVAQSLSVFGIAPQQLSGADLGGGDLSRFDVILVGVRAYAVRDDLRRHNQRLIDYVKQGGVLIVQYQTPEFDNNYGPFPYEMGRRPEEVSEENAEVTILRPDHLIFSEPNRITAKDFDGWVEQRGSKFLTSWDERYVPLLESHDTGQDPQRGGMLFARHEEGVYIYSAYAWYRQLPAGVPGAYRLLANMLSLPRTLVNQ